jgi:hypothetical protein
VAGQPAGRDHTPAPTAEIESCMAQQRTVLAILKTNLTKFSDYSSYSRHEPEDILSLAERSLHGKNKAIILHLFEHVFFLQVSKDTAGAKQLSEIFKQSNPARLRTMILNLIKQDIKLLTQEIGDEKIFYKEFNNSLLKMTKNAIIEAAPKKAETPSLRKSFSSDEYELKKETQERPILDCEELQTFFDSEKLEKFIQNNYKNQKMEKSSILSIRKKQHSYSLVDTILAGDVISISVKGQKQDFQRSLFGVDKYEFGWLKFFVKNQAFLKRLHEFIGYHSEISKAISGIFSGRCPEDIFVGIQIGTLEKWAAGWAEQKPSKVNAGACAQEEENETEVRNESCQEEQDSLNGDSSRETSQSEEDDDSSQDAPGHDDDDQTSQSSVSKDSSEDGDSGSDIIEPEQEEIVSKSSDTEIPGEQPQSSLNPAEKMSRTPQEDGSDPDSIFSNWVQTTLMKDNNTDDDYNTYIYESILKIQDLHKKIRSLWHREILLAGAEASNNKEPKL